MIEWYDPRDSWLPVVGLFAVALVFVIDLSRPGGFLESGLWVPVLYAVVPVAIGLLAYIRTRATTGLAVSLGVLVGLTAWGLIGAVVALIVALVIGLGSPSPPGPPSTVFNLLTGLLTYLVPTGAFAGLYGEAGRRPRRVAVVLTVAAPIVATIVLAVLVWLSW